MLISVVICTIGRSGLTDTLSSVLKSDFKNFEVVVVLSNCFYNPPISIKNNPKIKYFKIDKYGLSRARNLGIKMTKGKIIAFTDDDCIVDTYWLTNIYKSFKENEGVVGTFGQVLPWKPSQNLNKFCPCVFVKKTPKIITKPCLHWKHIGFGNNMAFNKKILKNNYRFKEWLGAKSIAGGPEDGELALRLLFNRYKIFYNPKAKVFHNCWLTKEEFRRRLLLYTCGEVACYGYFAIQGKKIFTNVITNNFKDSYGKLKTILKSFLTLKEVSTQELFNVLEEFYYRLRGLIIGLYFSKKEPFRTQL